MRDVKQDTKMGKLDLDSACACASRCTEEPDVGVSGLLASHGQENKGKIYMYGLYLLTKRPEPKVHASIKR